MAQVANDYYGRMFSTPYGPGQLYCGSQAMLPYRPKRSTSQPRQDSDTGALFNEIPRGPPSSAMSPNTVASKQSGRSSVHSRSSQSSATTNSNVRSLGNFSDLPPRDYFSSGASRPVEASGLGRQQYRQPRQRMPFPSDGNYGDDGGSDGGDSLVSPSDSVSQVSRGRTRRRTSSHGGGSVYGSESSVSCMNGGAPYWCEVNQKWLREVKPRRRLRE